MKKLDDELDDLTDKALDKLMARTQDLDRLADLLLEKGLVFFNRRSMISVQRLLVDEMKDYLTATLEDHRNQSAEMVGQDMSVQLATVKEELRVALADVVRAEAAQFGLADNWSYQTSPLGWA